MKKIIERISEVSDIDALKNVAKILCEHIECEPCSGRKMETMKEIATELEQYSYDEEMANMHLCLIGELHTAIDADLMWKAENGLTRYDWRVLWGQMAHIHTDKIKSWFTGISGDGLRRKIYDECITFLNQGLKPWMDINA